MSRAVEKTLARIEKKIDHLMAGETLPPPDVVGIREIMNLTGTGSTSGAYRLLAKLGIKPFTPGKYIRVDLTNAIHARAADLAHEARTESLIHHPVSTNPES